MYDKGPVPGRNDACWCGSGKKYKKCHSAFDERLERLWEEGWNVLPRTLYKTPADIKGIKRSAAINVGVLDYVGERIAAGMTTNQIDQMIYDYTVEHGGTPADLNYEGYPKSVCTSINDASATVSPAMRMCCTRATSSTWTAPRSWTVTLVIRAVCSASASLGRAPAPGRRHPRQRGGWPCRRQAVAAAVRDGRGCAKTVEDAGFSVVREYGGHGIGKDFHEDPFVGFTTEAPDVDTIMAPGMVFTIEPMVNAGAPDIKISKGDGWCVRTKDGSDSASARYSSW